MITLAPATAIGQKSPDTLSAPLNVAARARTQSGVKVVIAPIRTSVGSDRDQAAPDCLAAY